MCGIEVVVVGEVGGACWSMYGWMDVGGRVFVWRVSCEPSSAVGLAELTSGAELPRRGWVSFNWDNDLCETLHLTNGYVCSLIS